MQKINSPIARILLIFAALLPLLILVNNSFAQNVSKKVLNIPYFTQENGPDCWAASLLMITNAVNPKTDSNIIKVIRNVNEPDGISVRSMEEHQAFNSQISNLTGVNPNIETYWSGSNTQTSIAAEIKRRIDNDNPVMLCSTQSINGTNGGHCVVIVGYNGDNIFYIHDPRGTTGQVNLVVTYSNVFSSNASYALISVPKALSPNRHLLTARMVNKSLSLIKPKMAGKNDKTESIDFINDRNSPDGYSFANNPANSGNIPDGYNILSLEVGNAYTLVNSSDSLRMAKVKVDIKRKDGSKRLKSIEINKSLLPYSINTLHGKFNKQLSIMELRDSSKSVPCEVVYTYIDETTGSVFQKDVIDFTLEPSISDVKLTTEKKEKNRVSFNVQSALLPANAKFLYNIKLVTGKQIKKIETDQNPFEHSFLESGNYHVSVEVKQISRGLDDKGTNKRVSKELPFGSAEAFVNIDDFAKIKTTQNNYEFTFKLESDIAYSDVNWFMKEKTQSNFSQISQSGDEIIETINKMAEYNVKAVLINNLGDEIGIVKTKISLDSTNQKDKIDEAFKNKDWQTLYTIYTTSKSSEDKKLAGNYLGIIAKELNDYNIEILEKLVNNKKKINSDYKKAYDESLNSFDEKAECIQEMKEQYINDQKAIEEVINNINNSLELYNNYYTKLNPANDINKANPQKEIFSISTEIKNNKQLIPKETNYAAICTGNVEDSGNLNITLKPTKHIAISNEQVDLYAKFIQTPNVCSEDVSLKWSNNAVGSKYNEGYFVATAAGRYSPTVTAYCKGKAIGSASVGITVKGGVTGNITGLAENQIYFGTTKDIELKTDLIKAADVVDNSCDGNANNPFCVDTVHVGKAVVTSSKEVSGASVYIPNPSKEFEEEPEKTDYVVRWDSSSGLEFDPPEIEGDAYSKYKTKVTFNRMDNPIKIWANILQWKDGALETIGEADVAELEVIAPVFKIEFSPTQDKAKIGQEVKASITSTPSLNSKLIDFRWVEPTDRTDVKNGIISFTPKDGKTINIHVIARVPHYGDIIDDKIKSDYTPGEYVVIANLIGPKFDKSSQDWSSKEKGLVDVHRPLVTGQAILAEASVEGYNFDDVNYEWKSNDGCSIDAGYSSDEVTVSRSEAGLCNLVVTAYDKDRRKLGHDNLSFDIAEQDSSTTAKPKNIGDKENDQQKQEVAKLIDKAKQKATSGDYDGAEKLLEDAVKLDPNNKLANELKGSIKQKKLKAINVNEKLEIAKKSLTSGNLKIAEAELEKAIELDPANTEALELLETVKNKKLQQIKVAEMLKEARDNAFKGQLDEAGVMLEKLVKDNPKNKEAEELLKNVKYKKSSINNQFEKIKTLVANGSFDAAMAELGVCQNMSPGYNLNVEIKEYIENSKNNLINSKYLKAKTLVSAGKLDEAIEVLKGAISLNPNNITVVTYSNSINADKANLFKLKNSLHEALFKYKNYPLATKYMEEIESFQHPLYPPVIETKSWFDSAQADNPDNLMVNAEQSLENKEIEKAQSIIVKLKGNVTLTPDQLSRLKYLETKLSQKKAQVEMSDNLVNAMVSGDLKEAKRLITVIKANQDYYNPEIDKLNEIEKDIDARLAKISNYDKAKEELDRCEKAFNAGNYEQALALCKHSTEIVPNEHVDKLVGIIQNKITERNELQSQQQQQKNMANVTKIQMVNLKEKTSLRVSYPGDWDSKKTLYGDYEFKNNSVQRGLTMRNNVYTYQVPTQKDALIEQHINHMLSSSGYITKARGSKVIQGIRVHYVNLVFNEDGKTVYQSLYFPYNNYKIFEVLSSAENPAVGKVERDKILNNIIAAILAEKKEIEPNNVVNSTPNGSLSNIKPWITKLEYGTDRPGNYYSSVVPSSSDPELCAVACEKNTRCRSFTYVEPGIKGTNAVCYYRDYIPKSIAAIGHVSGVVKFIDINTLKSSSSNNTTNTTNSTSLNTKSKVAPQVVFVNKSGMPTHFYGQNESCSGNNKVNPGGKHIRALMVGSSNSSVRTFYAGRNGSTIAKVDVPVSSISQRGQKVYVIYDSSGKLYWNK